VHAMSRSGTPSIVPPGPDCGVGRAAILLLSLAVLLLEVAYTRIFSFSLWYHFTYVALSVALLGYGASGAFLAASERLARQPPALLMSRCMVVAAGAVLVSLLTIVFLPLQPFSIASSPLQLVLMVLFFLLNSAPFFAAGMAMASAFRATRSPHAVYFADLHRGDPDHPLHRTRRDRRGADVRVPWGSAGARVPRTECLGGTVCDRDAAPRARDRTRRRLRRAERPQERRGRDHGGRARSGDGRRGAPSSGRFQWRHPGACGRASRRRGR